MHCHVDLVTGTPQLLIRIDREAIASYGINVEDVQRVVEAAVGGRIAGQRAVDKDLVDGRRCGAMLGCVSDQDVESPKCYRMAT